MPIFYINTTKNSASIAITLTNPALNLTFSRLSKAITYNLEPKSELMNLL